jgi:hypothetical protein
VVWWSGRRKGGKDLSICWSVAKQGRSSRAIQIDFRDFVTAAGSTFTRCENLFRSTTRKDNLTSDESCAFVDGVQFLKRTDGSPRRICDGQGNPHCKDNASIIDVVRSPVRLLGRLGR